MADVPMPPSTPCVFNKKGWAPCGKPSTNGLCTKHEAMKCVSCGEQAFQSCDMHVGGLACGSALCKTCRHALGGEWTHVTETVYETQKEEERIFRTTKKESARMLALRGVRTDIELPRHLKELLEGELGEFYPRRCYCLVINNTSMYVFPAILKDTRIAVITPDKEAIIRIWRSLKPRDSKIVSDFWLVNDGLGVAYCMCPELEQEESRPHKLFTGEDIESLFENDPNPFVWAPGLLGGGISEQAFMTMIEQAAAV